MFHVLHSVKFSVQTLKTWIVIVCMWMCLFFRRFLLQHTNKKAPYTIVPFTAWAHTFFMWKFSIRKALFFGVCMCDKGMRLFSWTLKTGVPAQWQYTFFFLWIRFHFWVLAQWNTDTTTFLFSSYIFRTHTHTHASTHTQSIMLNVILAGKNFTTVHKREFVRVWEIKVAQVIIESECKKSRQMNIKNIKIGWSNLRYL